MKVYKRIYRDPFSIRLRTTDLYYCSILLVLPLCEYNTSVFTSGESKTENVFLQIPEDILKDSERAYVTVLGKLYIIT